jgi:hypothetical protein
MFRRRLRSIPFRQQEHERQLLRREVRRRTALTELLLRFTDAPDTPDAATIDVIWQLTSFETYDAIAARDQTRTPEDVAHVIAAAATAVHHSMPPT